MVMTQQYLAGELSVLLAQLHGVTTGSQHVREVDRLREQAETVPIRALGWVTTSALRVAEALCWDSLARGDMEAFDRQAEVSAQIHEFGVCAALLTER
jgi:cytosine/adenosine deaminase-related metal-dependent hydrolase